MGLSTPGQVVRMESDRVGIVDINGTTRRVRLALVIAGGARVSVGDWLLVQLDLAVASLGPAEASELAQLIAAIPASAPAKRAA